MICPCSGKAQSVFGFGVCLNTTVSGNIVNTFPYYAALSEKHDRLIQDYVADHVTGLRSLKGIRRWIARLGLEVQAWRYASQELPKHEPLLRKRYLGR